MSCDACHCVQQYLRVEVSDSSGCLIKFFKSLQIRVVDADSGSQTDGLGARKLSSHADIICTFIKKAK